MRLFLNYLPTLSLCTVYQGYNLIFSMKIFIIMLIISFIIKIILYKDSYLTHTINFIILMTLSFLTLIFKKKSFLQLQNTIFYGVFSILAIFSQIFMKKTMIQTFGEKKIDIPKKHWKIMNIIWSVFFIISSIINYYLICKIHNKIWNKYKIFAFPIVCIIFFLLTLIYIFFIKKKKNDKCNSQGKD
ncbi:Intracellular septation protein [Buchnera aphidicola (Sipha maydis)]